MRLITAMEEFAADLQLAGRMPGTIEKHKLELSRLGRWCEGCGHRWDELDKRTLQPFVRERATLGYSARSNMLCSLRTFYRWAVEQGYIAMSPAASFKTPQRPKPLPRSLTREQLRRLVATLAAVEGRRARRDEVLLLTAIYAGLRAKELASLQWHHVDLDAAIISIIISKMQHGRVVPIHKQLGALLSSWKETQGAGGRGPVFALDGRQFVANRVGKIARQWRAASGVQFTTHMLRHSFATWALRASGDLYAVSKALGHSELKQTEIYVSADPEQLRSMVAALPNLGEW